MVQRKKAVATPKKAINAATPNKKGALKAKMEIADVVPALKTPSKNAKKQPIKQVPVDNESDEDDEQDDVNLDDGSDSEDNDLIDNEAEESDDEDAEDDDAEDDDDEGLDAEDDEPEPGEVSIEAKKQNPFAAKGNDNDKSDEDEAPVEEPIAKRDAANKKKPKNKIPKNIPKDQVVIVSNLPKGYDMFKLEDLLEKFGRPLIDPLHDQIGEETSSVRVAFERAEIASDALSASGKDITFEGHELEITRPLTKEDLNACTVTVSLIGADATKEDLFEHFKSCGTVTAITFSNNRTMKTGFVRFKTLDGVENALKLNSSQMKNGRYISVRSIKHKNVKSPSCTIIAHNNGKYESYKYETIEKIFKKCGEIAEIDIVCTRSVLAFITFKEPESVEKAKELSGKKFGDLEIELSNYNFNSSARTILITNLSSGVTIEDLKELFSETGEIDYIKVLTNKAIIKYVTNEGYCHSFLLNERNLKGQPIFIEPNSMLKHKILKRKQSQIKSSQAFKANKSGGNRQQRQAGPFKKFNNKRPHQGDGKPRFNKRIRDA